MYPCEIEMQHTPGLGTYYAITSLMVVILAISLIWIPFVQLISEINIIIAKLVIYFNGQFLGSKNTCLCKGIESLLISQNSLFTISFGLMSYVLYLISGDFLLSAACYISTLPNIKYLRNIKALVLRVIESILNLKGPEKDYTKRRTEERSHDYMKDHMMH